MKSSDQKGGGKRRLIHDLQTFLWQFEQGGYTKETMHTVLARLEKVLEDDGRELGGALEGDLQKMLFDCRTYAEGKGESEEVVKDLDRLRRDLEQ